MMPPHRFGAGAIYPKDTIMTFASRVQVVALLAALSAVLVSAAAAATELPIQSDAQKILGADVKGDNWTVAPVVASDGFVRIFNVETPYGKFQVSSQRRMDERLGELRALQALEKMSRSKIFVDAVAKAGLAPLRFGRDLLTDPLGTTGNVLTGVGNMLDSAVSTVSGKNAGRDPLFNDVVGITKAERDLALTLKVDPYSDFLPLRIGLREVARVMAAGDISVSAAISAIPGGAGIAVSASSTASALDNSVYSKTSNEIAALVTAKLGDLGIDGMLTKKLVDNRFYSPADEFALADALQKLGASNCEAFVSRAADANTADVAKLYLYRAELLEKESGRVGVIKSFAVISGAVLNRTADGKIAAIFPFDDLAWTGPVSQSLTRVSTEIGKGGQTPPSIFATTGTLSPMAESELKKLGWTIEPLDRK